MNRRETVIALLALGAAAPSLYVVAQTQRPSVPFRVGLLPDLDAGRLNWFADAMRTLGWVEGSDYVIVSSGLKRGLPTETIATRMVTASSHLRQEDIDAGTQRLVSEKPDLILATSTAYAVAAHRASHTIPIVMWTGGYPVEAGIADSLSRPGKNVTGSSIYAGTGVWGKLLELLRDTKPGIKRVGVLWDYVPPAFSRDEIEPCHQELKRAASTLGLGLQIVEVARADQLQDALRAIETGKPDALLVTSGWGLLQVRQRVMQYAAEKRLPVIVDFRWRALLDPYPLLVYGAAQGDLMKSAASYATKILQGARAGDLPIQQPMRFELVVSRRTANALGITLPKMILMRADEVID